MRRVEHRDRDRLRLAERRERACGEAGKASMRIVQINTTDERGGAARVAAQLHVGYRARGVDATFVVGRRSHTPCTVGGRSMMSSSTSPRGDGVMCMQDLTGRPTPASLLRRTAEHLALHADARAGAWRASRALHWLAEPGRMRQQQQGVEDFHHPATWRIPEHVGPADLVHAHNLHGGYFDLRALPWLSNRQPLVITMHDPWMLTGHCAHPFGCDRWRRGCGQCPALETYPAVAADATDFNWRRKREIYSRASVYIATPSHWLMDMVEQSMLRPAILDARVIPNGVDLSVFTLGDREDARRRLRTVHESGLGESQTPAGTPIDEDTFVGLFVGDRLGRSPWKDSALIEAAVREAARRRPEQRMVVFALGDDGPSVTVGPHAEVRPMGFVSCTRTLVDFYQASDVYLHAAHADTFPTVVLEAMGCGLPVIATAVGGIPEQVEPGRTGALTPPGDVDAMASRIVECMDDPQRWRPRGEAGRLRAEQQYSVEAQTKSYLSWFEQILANHKRLQLAA